VALRPQAWLPLAFARPQQTIDSASSEKHQLIRRMKQMCSSQCGHMHIHIKVIAVPPPLTDMAWRLDCKKRSN
jgi:hypothetical protein